MIHFAFLFFKNWKVTAALSVIFLAVADATSNRTLIYVALIGSATTLLMTWMNGRAIRRSTEISQQNAASLKPLEKLPATVEELRKNTDGIQDELKASRLQTSEAKQDLARAEGTAAGSASERDRKIEPGAPIPKVIVANEDDNPAVVRSPKQKTDSHE